MKFGSTWLKAALLGSAMLIAGGVFAEEGPKTHKLTITPVEGATVTVTVEGTPVANEGQVAEGKTLVVDVKITDAKKEVESVKLGETAATLKDGKYEVAMPTADATLTVTLKAKGEAPKTHKLTITPVEGATVTVTVEGAPVANEGQVAEGSTLVIEVNVTDAKKEVESVKLGETDATPKEGKYEVAMPAADATLTVKLKDKGEAPKTHKLTIAKVEGATVTVTVDGKAVANEGQVAEGSKLVVDVKVTDTKKEVASVKLGETAATLKDGKYEVLMPKADATLTVTLKAKGTPKPGAVEDNAFAAVSVYPNPFADMLTVNEVAEASRVTLVNAQGVVLRSVAVNGANQIALDVTDVPAGIYMVVVENGAARRAFKVVK